MQRFVEHKGSGHPIERADARVKLLSAIALLVMVLSYRGWAFPLLIAFVCLWICVRVRVPVRMFALRFSEPAFIAVMVVLLKALFSGARVLCAADIFGLTVTVHADGLIDGLTIAARMAGAVSVAAVVGFTTPFAETMAALSWLRVPKALVEVMMFAYRYIFVLVEDAFVIYNAQKNRLGYSGLRRGLASFGMLAGALVIKAFENSQHTAIAMAQRGYDGEMPMLRHRAFRGAEVAASLVFVALMGAAWKL